MSLQIVIMPGSSRIDIAHLRTAAQDFGWPVHIARNVRELMEVGAKGRIGAVLFQQDSLSSDGSWLETISILRAVAPEVHLVACNQFSEMMDLPKLCRVGLFHALWLPLKDSEVRQCFGFVWEADQRANLAKKAVSEKEAGKVHLVRAAG